MKLPLFIPLAILSLSIGLAQNITPNPASPASPPPPQKVLTPHFLTQVGLTPDEKDDIRRINASVPEGKRESYYMSILTPDQRMKYYGLMNEWHDAHRDDKPVDSTNDSSPSYNQNSIVIVQGNNKAGTGFLIKWRQATYVITNQHVISNNPNLTLQTLGGQKLVATAVQGAIDRDLVMFAVIDNGTLTTLPYATDVMGMVHEGDDTVAPGNSQGGGVIVNTLGTIVDVGPVRVEVSNPVYPGNSGGPVVDLGTKQAVGVITEVERSEEANWCNKTILVEIVRYYSLRFDNVPKWEPFDIQTFYSQTHFIEEFHQRSLELLSLFKSMDETIGRRYGTYKPSPDYDEVDEKLYLDNQKLVDLLNSYNDRGSINSSEDKSQRIQRFAWDLNTLAETNMTLIENPNLFYMFNRSRAAEEVTLRKKIISTCKDLPQNLLAKTRILTEK